MEWERGAPIPGHTSTQWQQWQHPKGFRHVPTVYDVSVTQGAQEPFAGADAAAAAAVPAGVLAAEKKIEDSASCSLLLDASGEPDGMAVDGDGRVGLRA